VTSASGAARHRRRGRQVQHPDGQGHRRPAHRPAGRQEGRSAAVWPISTQGRHGLRPRLRKGLAHGEDLRRLGMVPLRHAGFHGPGRRSRNDMWGSWTPHKVKLAVSGCPRNCAEATIKDVGVICVDSGYEIHFGGNGGINRAPRSSARSPTEDEVLEPSRASCSSIARRAAISSASTNGSSGGARRDPAASSTTPNSAARPFRRFSTPKNSRKSTRGLERGRARRSHEFGPWRPSAWSSEAAEWMTQAMDWIGCRHARRHPAARRARRATPQGDIAVFRTAADRCSRSRPLPAQGRPAQPGHRARPWRHLPAAQLVIDLETGDRRRAGPGLRDQSFPSL
jgi:hypothetical protein